MKFNELGRLPERNGWYVERVKKHNIYVHPQKPGIKIPVGKHGTEEVPTGTLNSILKAAGLK